jgi:hypothetical protein
VESGEMGGDANFSLVVFCTTSIVLHRLLLRKEKEKKNIVRKFAVMDDLRSKLWRTIDVRNGICALLSGSPLAMQGMPEIPNKH